MKDTVITVKFYDKVLDYISREFIHWVGSRTSAILGSSRGQTEDQEKIRRAKFMGQTRVELSLHFDRIKGRLALNALRDSDFLSYIEELHGAIADQVLNNVGIHKQVWRSIEASRLISEICTTPVNALIVGLNESFLVNCAAVMKDHAVGTFRSMPLTGPNSEWRWNKIKEFV